MFQEIYELAKAKYEERVAEDERLPWYFGKNQLSQNTAQARVVVVPNEQMDLLFDLDSAKHIGAGTVGGQTDLAAYSFYLQIYIFAPLADIFDTRESEVYKHWSKVTSAFYVSLVGPYNFRFTSEGMLQQQPNNNPTVSLWALVYNIQLVLPTRLDPNFLDSGESVVKSVVFTGGIA